MNQNNVYSENICEQLKVLDELKAAWPEYLFGI